jgi:putative endopeptidase
MRRFFVVMALALAAMTAMAQNAKTEKKNDTKPAANMAAKSQQKAIPGFDVTALDKNADPCTDFYQFACGGWEARTQIPPDQAIWGRFSELNERNQETLRDILTKDEINSAKRNPVARQVGDFYAACMDEKLADEKGTAPMQPLLEKIAALKSKADLPALVAKLHDQGVRTMFDFGSQQDFGDASKVIAGVDQGGLGLPDRDYYLKEDAKSVELRKAYVANVEKMFELAGDKPEEAAAEADAVMTFETGLAKVAMSRVDRRDPQKVYHRMDKAQLEALAPDFSFAQYLQDTNPPAFTEVNVAVPDFVKGMDALLKTTDLAALKSYLRWGVIRGSAPFLSKPFVDQNFAFYGKTLTGAKEIRPRWKRCVALTDDELGEALGQEYVALKFPPSAKAHTQEMVDALERALGEDIQQLDWMTPETKKAALVKLHAIQNKIGYPEKWRDYSSVIVKRDDLLGNVRRADAFEVRRQLNKIGKPVDKQEWGMTPPTVNAYYDPQMNNINFPAGILQPPFYTNGADNGINFGGIGAVIGHELTHGFDDEGRQFDAQGNLKDWWTPADAKAFNERAQCIVDEYSGFEPVPGVHLNGKLTLGENTADNGGLRIALMAMENSEKGKKEPKIDGFTQEQRVFLGWSQVWCSKQTPEIARLRATVDPHSPGRFRVDGVVRNMPEFQQAFGCKTGQPMAPANRCHVW